MKCEQCGKDIPEVVMIHKDRRVMDTLSNLSKIYHLFCSDNCQRTKEAEDWKKKHPHG